MYKLLLVISILVLLVLGCRKKEPVDVLTSDEYEPVIEHCFNGYKDSNELGIDCGGDCADCEEFPYPCELAVDTIQFDFTSSGYEVTNKTQGVGGPYEYRAYINSTDYFSFKFYTLPDVTIIYQGIGSQEILDEDNEVRMKFYQQGISNHYGYGDLYAYYYNSGFRFIGCDIPFAKYSSPSNFSVSFNVTFD